MKKALSALCFLVVLLLSLSLLYRVFSWKNEIVLHLSSVQQLHETEDDLMDLVFVGTSHVYCGVNTAQIWNDTGIAAFNMGVSSMDRVSTKQFLRELFKTQSPQVVCLDLYALLFDKIPEEFNVYRNYLALGPSLNRLQALLEYRPDDLGAYLTRWPILHDRYKELTAFDFVQYTPSIFGRGQYYVFDTLPLDPDLTVYDRAGTAALSEDARAWLQDIYTLCREHGSQLITMIIPAPVEAEQQAVINGAKEYLATLGVDCLDLNEEAPAYGLDYANDFFDSNHTNVYGARKVTGYLIDQLRSRYTFPDRRGDARYTLWEENARYDQYQWGRHAFETGTHSDLPGTLETLYSCPGMVFVMTVPPDYQSGNTSWRDTLARCGVPEAEIDAKGQWVIRDGQVLAHRTADDARAVSVDLNAVDTLTLNHSGQWEVEINGQDCGILPEALSLVVYDNYQAEFLETLNY